MTEHRTSGGVPITGDVVEQLSAEAEDGYDPGRLRRRDGHDLPPLVYPALAPKPRWVYMGVCRHCGSEKPMRLFWRLKADPSLKVNAVWWPWAACEGCGHESEGQVTHTHDGDSLDGDGPAGE